jgi:hypothetical protein
VLYGEPQATSPGDILAQSHRRQRGNRDDGRDRVVVGFPLVPLYEVRPSDLDMGHPSVTSIVSPAVRFVETRTLRRLTRRGARDAG